MNRTPIYAALITALTAMKTAGVVKDVRRPRNAQDFVVPPVVPCALVIGDKEIVGQRRGLPARVEMMADVHLHADVRASETPADRIDILLAAIEAALAPPPGDVAQTLGGTVSHCWIEGDIERFEMLPENKCLVIVPIHILAP